MDFPKLLIADEADEYRQALEETLGKQYIVRTCRSGSQALELLRSFRPDILVTDLMLPELDGLTLLQMAAEIGIRPKILVTAYHFSPYMQAMLERLQVDYTMRKPCSLQAVACRLADFAAELTVRPLSSYDPEDLIANVLLRLGMRANLDGFRYLLTAVPLYSHDRNQAITKELYTAVAEAHSKESRQVERSIRSAIHRTWNLHNGPVWAEYFIPGPDGTVPRPSNGEFIGRLALLLIEQANQSKAC